MKKTLLLFVYTIATLICHAQHYTNQNKVWVFGDHSGIDFTSGTPVAITTAIFALEGCASVSDTAGSLLFYTDGKDVYNRSHTLMPNGSSIVSYNTYSSTQGAVIAPIIGYPNQYYVFSLEEFYGATNFCHLSYSIVDMTLDGGNGDVLTTVMGIPITDRLTEKMIIVPGNSCDMWLLVHSIDTARFFAYHITNTGISLTPVVSSVGILSVDGPNGPGVLKVSPDRSKLALNWYTMGGLHGTELFDFNPTTGTVSNPQVLDSLHDTVYGLEFSPDNTKLYVDDGTGIVQYDVSLSTTAAIVASRTMIIALVYLNSLKLGPDNKLYMGYGNRIDCIPFPNTAGTACGFVPSVVFCDSGTHCLGGLPGIFYSIGPGDTTYTHHDTLACRPSDLGITIWPVDTGLAYQWYDGTTTTRTKGGITLPGSYWVKIWNGCNLTIDTIHVSFYDCHAGVAQVSNANEPFIFPNPVSGKFTIKDPSGTYTSFTITNALGQQILHSTISRTETIIDATLLPIGIYHITYTGATGTIVQRFLKE